MKPLDEWVAWLLDAKTPSIVHQTLAEPLLCRSSVPRIRAAKARILRAGAVPAILSRQSKRGSWRIDRGYYGPKFYSTHWSMMLLAELGAEGRDRRFRAGAEHMLRATQQAVREGLDRNVMDWSCFWGNLLRYVVRAGMRGDPRVEAVSRLLASMVKDGLCVCRINGGEACAWGMVRSLWGFAAIPEKDRTPDERRAVRKGVRYLLEDHSLADADYPVAPGSRINPLWFKLNFPLFYQADILLALRVLDELEAIDHRGARKALDWLESRRGRTGRWRGSSPFRTRTWREMGDPEETDRWVTLQAMRILRHAGRAAR
jgi:hypothetical protein